MAEENRDVRLKDGDIYLYPLAREDDTGRVIRDTYLTKTGEDSYISDAKVESYIDPTTEIEVNVLTLTNKSEPEKPIKFVGGDGGFATWGFIKGDINEQGDLVTYTDRAVSLKVSQKNRIFRQATKPEDTSEYTLQDGDMWYVTGDVEGYSKYRWYVYKIYASGESEWVLTADNEISENTSRISVTNEKIETEVTAREGADAKLSSKITQTATGIKLEVGQTRTRYTEPKDEPPTGSEENPIMPGDLWYCSDGSKSYVKDTWYIYEDGAWRPATEDEIRTVDSKIEQQADRITSEVERIDGDIVTANTRIDQTATDIVLEAEAREKADDDEVIARNAAIKVSADEIKSEVSEVRTTAEGAQSTASTAITQSSTAITQSAQAVTTADGAQTTANTAITQSAEAIKQSAEAVTIAGDAETHAQTAITQSADAITLSSEAKTIADGAEETAGQAVTIAKDRVSFEDLVSGTKTHIKGDFIDTGTINASKVTISGHLSAASIDANKIAVNGQSIGTSSSDKLDSLYSTTINGGTINASTSVNVANGRYILINGMNDSSNDAKLDATSIYILSSAGSVVKSKTWSDIIDGSGGGEPDAYLKSASVSGNTLTLTKKDNTKVTFTPTAKFG